MSKASNYAFAPFGAIIRELPAMACAENKRRVAQGQISASRSGQQGVDFRHPVADGDFLGTTLLAIVAGDAGGGLPGPV